MGNTWLCITTYTPGARDPRRQQALGEVLQPVAAFESQGRHGAREDNGHGKTRYLVFQHDAGFHHGVRAVCDHHRRGFAEAFANRIEHLPPVLLGHLQAVFVHQQRTVHVKIGQPHGSQIAVDLAVEILNGSRLLRVDFLDGAAGAKNVDALHRRVRPATGNSK